MKVFISWSGKRSRLVAELLKSWLPCVLQAVEPWISSEDIDGGSVWFREILTGLKDCSIGIICLTRENLNAPWILFEAGALAKGLETPRVCTLLIDVKPRDVEDPLAQFHHTDSSKDSIFKLIRSINERLDKPLEPKTLDSILSLFWDEFERKLSAIIEETQETENKPARGDGDILGEVLDTVRSLDRRVGPASPRTYSVKVGTPGIDVEMGQRELDYMNYFVQILCEKREPMNIDAIAARLAKDFDIDMISARQRVDEILLPLIAISNHQRKLQDQWK